MGLAAVVAELVERPLFAFSDGELVALVDEVFGCCARLDGVLLRLVREVDARGIAAAAGATGTGVWLRERERISPHRAGLLTRLAATLDGTQTGQALAAGQVNLEQAAVIARAVAQVPAGQRSEGEALLVKQAATFGPRELARLGDRLVDVTDPDGADAAEAAQLDRAERRAYAGRELFLTDVGAGRVRLTGWLDGESAAVVRAALDPLCSPRTAGVDGRSPAQRRVDALVDICRGSLAGGELPDNGGDRPQLAVTIDWAALRRQLGAATLDDGQALSPKAARRIACDAAILPVVLGGAGQPLDVGRERRLFTGPLRRAVLLRDGGCAFPDCDRPPRWTAVHHITHWADGGPTSLTNAVALCGHHHTVIHHSQWRVEINPSDGLPDFYPPPGHLRPGPLRNRHRARDMKVLCGLGR